MSEKRRIILEAARALFLEHGFDGTSVDAVTAAAGVSKPTVYSHFATKESLLDAVVAAEGERVGIPVAFRVTGDVARDLEAAARILMEIVLAPETLAWDRMMAGEARRRPELGRIFLEQGPRRLIKVLSDFLVVLAQGGDLNLDDPERAAEFFFGMAVGLPLLGAQLGAEKPSPRRINARCRDVAERFRRAYSPLG